MNTTDWTAEDYKALVLIYAANVDAEVQEEEEEVIVAEVGGERATRMKKAVAKLSDYEMLQVLEEERNRFYPGEEGKKILLAEVKELFKADGVYSQVEQVIARNLERLL